MSTTGPAPCDAGRVRSEPAGPPPAGSGVIAATVLGSSLSYIDSSVVNVALPAMAADLDAGATGVQWIVNGYMLPLAALVLIGGALADRVGRKRVFLAGLWLFAAASVGCMLAPSLPALIAARVGQGIGAALLVPASLAILGSSFSGEARAKAVGTWAAAGAAGGAIGPVLGGLLTDFVGWRGIFALLLPIAACAIGFGHRAIPPGKLPSAHPPDGWGAALATISLGAIAWGLTVVSDGRYRTGAAMAAGGALIFLAFLLVERRRGERAMMPLALFRSSVFSGVTLLTFLLYAALGGMLLLLPVLLIGQGWSATAAGSAILPFPVIMGLGSRSAGALAGRIGPRVPLTIGPIVASAGFALLARVPADGADFAPHVLPAMVVLGIGMTLAVAPLTDTVLAAVEAGRQGAASGVNNATARVAGLFAVSLAGFVLAEGGGSVSLQAFQVAAWIAGVLGVLGGLAAWFSIPAAWGPDR